MLNKKMIYGLFILFVGLTMSFNTAVAQVTEDQEMSSPTSFSAIVVDASNGQPLSDVTVKVKDTEMEATTDQAGKFTFDNLNVPVGTPSQPGSVDFQSQEVTFEINHEGYQPFSKTLSIEEIRQHQQTQTQAQTQTQTQDQTQDRTQDQAMQDDSQLMKFELEPVSDEDEYEQE